LTQQSATAAALSESLSRQELQAAELKLAETGETAARATAELERRRAALREMEGHADAARAAAREEEARLSLLQGQVKAAERELELLSRTAARADRQLQQLQGELAALRAQNPHLASVLSLSASVTALPHLHNTHINGQQGATGGPEMAGVTGGAGGMAAVAAAEAAALQVRLVAAEARRQLAEERCQDLNARVQVGRWDWWWLALNQCRLTYILQSISASQQATNAQPPSNRADPAE
jgi:hypothetical protein